MGGMTEKVQVFFVLLTLHMCVYYFAHAQLYLQSPAGLFSCHCQVEATLRSGQGEDQRQGNDSDKCGSL